MAAALPHSRGRAGVGIAEELMLLVPSGSLERHESAIVGYRIDAEAAGRVPAV
jgi:hypothetical protein